MTNAFTAKSKGSFDTMLAIMWDRWQLFGLKTVSDCRKSWRVFVIMWDRWQLLGLKKVSDCRKSWGVCPGPQTKIIHYLIFLPVLCIVHSRPVFCICLSPFIFVLCLFKFLFLLFPVSLNYYFVTLSVSSQPPSVSCHVSLLISFLFPLYLYLILRLSLSRGTLNLCLAQSLSTSAISLIQSLC